MDLKVIKIIKLPDVLNRTAWSRSTLYLRIKQGLFPKPISLGARAVGFVDAEVQSIVSAMIASKSADEIKQLVKELVAARKH